MTQFIHKLMLMSLDVDVLRKNDHIPVVRLLRAPTPNISNEIRFIDRIQNPPSIIVWAGVSADSRINLIFVPQGVRINLQEPDS